MGRPSRASIAAYLKLTAPAPHGIARGHRARCKAPTSLVWSRSTAFHWRPLNGTVRYFRRLRHHGEVAETFASDRPEDDSPRDVSQSQDSSGHRPPDTQSLQVQAEPT